MYFPGQDFQDQAQALGEGPYPIGIRAMGKNVEREIQGSLDQGLIPKPITLEDLYFRTTLNPKREDDLTTEVTEKETIIPLRSLCPLW